MIVVFIVLTVIYLLGLFFFSFLSAALSANANTQIRLSKMSRIEAWKELWIVPIFWPFYIVPALIEYHLFKSDKEDTEDK